jgi:hypothetical protein
LITGSPNSKACTTQVVWVQAKKKKQKTQKSEVVGRTTTDTGVTAPLP